MANYDREGLKAAAASFARTMRQVAAAKTQATAAAVNVRMDGSEAVVSAGHQGGAWGWEPIQAAMFDNNLRHPLYGDKKHWYHQGRFPITSRTERAGSDSAVNAYIDGAIDPMLEDHGFTD